MHRKKIRILSFFAALTLLFAAVFIMHGLGRRTANERMREEKLGALLQLTEYTQNLTPALEKAAAISSPALFSEQLGIIVENAACARLSLDVLTDGSEDYASLQRVFRQTGDFALYLQRELSAGRELPLQRRKALQELAAFTNSLCKRLTLLSGAVLSGEKSFEGTKPLLGKGSIPLLNEELPAINNALNSLPRLIYNGPFSDEKEYSPQKISKIDVISKDKAMETAAKFLEIEPILLRELPEQSEPYLAYCWYYGNRSVKVAAKSGVVSELIKNARAGAAAITNEEAQSAAAKFLKKLGFNNMQAVSAQDIDGVRRFEFVPVVDGVTYYPDAVKVSVALDTGDVASFDALMYVMNHRERDLPMIKLTAKTALDLLPSGLEAIGEPGLALISKRNTEILCWEINCKSARELDAKSVSGSIAADGSAATLAVPVEYMIYLNAVSGIQEDVVLVPDC